MTQDIAECIICCYNYDTTRKQIQLYCNNTMCHECTKHIMSSLNDSCPFCREKLTFFRHIHNYYLIDVYYIIKYYTSCLNIKLIFNISICLIAIISLYVFNIIIQFMYCIKLVIIHPVFLNMHMLYSMIIRCIIQFMYCIQIRVFNYFTTS
jgi:hypothetical protein